MKEIHTTLMGMFTIYIYISGFFDNVTKPVSENKFFSNYTLHNVLRIENVCFKNRLPRKSLGMSLKLLEYFTCLRSHYATWVVLLMG
jgi:hypothetical protein